MIVLLLIFLVDLSHQNKEESEFGKWKEKFGYVLYEKFHKSEKQASHDFYKNLLEIYTHNMNESKTYEQGLNYDSFLTFQEKLKYRMGVEVPKKVTKREITESFPKSYDILNKFNPPEKVNFTHFFPLPVKEQGTCLSCWAITTIDIIESILYRRGRGNYRLSVQNLVDCDKKNNGCNGGWAGFAFAYARDEGLSNGTRYKYTGVKSECKRVGKKFPSIVKIKDYCEINVRGKEDLLKKIIARYGPISGAMSTTNSFTNYKGGVFYDIHCRNDTVDHAVTIVGYGSDKNSGDYWIIRNSWGTQWGMNGYGLIARNRNNACGIALYAIFPCRK